VHASSKLRAPFGENNPLDLAAIIGFSIPSGKKNNYGPWVRDPVFLNTDEASDGRSYTNKNFAGRFGAAATLDFGKMDAIPLLFHLNYSYRLSLGKNTGDYPKIHSMAAALELTPAPVITIFGEFYNEILGKSLATNRDLKFFDLSTGTLGMSFHLSKNVDVQLGGQLSLGKRDKYVQGLSLSDGTAYNARVIPKHLAFVGLTVQLFSVEPVYELPNVVFNISEESVMAGQFVTLNWITTGADEVSIEGMGTVPAQGSMKVKPNETTTYTLIATNQGGSKKERAKVVVESVAGPSVVFTPSKESIKLGEEIVLSWTVNDATEVRIEGIENLNTVPAQGSRRVSPSKTTTYTIIATGEGGTRTEMIEIVVESAPAPIIIFTADAESVQKGHSITLNWKVENATQANLEGIGPVQLQGTRKVKINEAKTFMLTATGLGGTITATVDVDVEAPPPIEKQVNLKGVNFLSGKAELTLDARRVLDGVAEQLLASPDVRIEIHGHTDGQGNPKTNQQLSERRAKAVVGYLASKGVRTNRMRAVGFGSDVPIADNKTPAGRELNRRIEMIRVN
jgi:outer membrane protein OmpA-like peptidoglycan-associated protein/plastocyanin